MVDIRACMYAISEAFLSTHYFKLVGRIILSAVIEFVENWILYKKVRHPLYLRYTGAKTVLVNTLITRPLTAQYL